MFKRLSLWIVVLAIGCSEATPPSEKGGDILLSDTTSPRTPETHQDTGIEADSEPVATDSTGPDVPIPPDTTVEEDTAPPSTFEANLVINEIMYDPKASSDETGEWFEIYNAGSTPVDLQGWTIRDKKSNAHTIATSVIIEAERYGVLGRGGDTTTNGGYSPDYVYVDFFLANSADSILLVDPSGKTVDQLSYQSEGDWPEKTAGVSIELVETTSDNETGGNWVHAVATYGAGDKGTPGGPNGTPIPDFDLDETIPIFQNPELETSLYFSPHDGLQDRVLSALAQAKTQVRLAFFNVRLVNVVWVLEALVQDGVDVHVVLDQKQQSLEYNTMGEQLVEAGIPVTLVENTAATQATMHQKVIVIDGETVLTGSPNLSSTALNKSDEDLLIINSTDIASRYLAEIDEILADGYEKSEPYPENTVVQAWMGPEDDLDGKVMELIANAESTILVAMFQINQAQLINALIEAKSKGIAVVVIMDGIFKAEGDAEVQLQEAGIPVILAENTLGMYAEMHSKLIIIDQEIAAMGSYNWTNLASFHNHESLVILDHSLLATRAAGKFAELINTYGNGNAEELGLETGPREVTFSVINVQLQPDATLFIQSIGDGPFQDPTPLTGNTLTVTLETGTRLDYRYLVQGDNGTTWDTESHFFTVPYADGSFSVTDVFVP